MEVHAEARALHEVFIDSNLQTRLVLLLVIAGVEVQVLARRTADHLALHEVLVRPLRRRALQQRVLALIRVNRLPLRLPKRKDILANGERLQLPAIVVRVSIITLVRRQATHSHLLRCDNVYPGKNEIFKFDR